jgi:hypothetical protein
MSKLMKFNHQCLLQHLPEGMVMMRFMKEVLEKREEMKLPRMIQQNKSSSKMMRQVLIILAVVLLLLMTTMVSILNLMLSMKMRMASKGLLKIN